MPDEIPEVRFDDSIARPIFPRPELKCAVLVHIPQVEDGNELPTFIKPEWGGVQIFFGDYYAIINGGEVIYGSAKEQWEAMHTQITDDRWVKTGIPIAYRATETCRVVTLIPEKDGSIREASTTLQPGDWVVRQPGGEVQHVKAEKYPKIYFDDHEADALGLTNLTREDFAAWAVSQVSSHIGTS